MKKLIIMSFLFLNVKAITIGIIDNDGIHGEMVQYIIKEFSKTGTKIETCLIPEKFYPDLYLECLEKISKISDIINISISGDVENYKERDIINFWSSKGKIFVASAGNDNKNELKYPAFYSKQNNRVFSVMYHDNYKKGELSNYPADISSLGIFYYKEQSFEGCSVAVAFMSAVLSYFNTQKIDKQDFLKKHVRKSLYPNVSNYLYYNHSGNNGL